MGLGSTSERAVPPLHQKEDEASFAPSEKGPKEPVRAVRTPPRKSWRFATPNEVSRSEKPRRKVVLSRHSLYTGKPKISPSKEV
ncbi:MAG: hypothetical protein DRN81_05730 [Thermoproteota archaeon]|nr:MAG: hypothetical protein DRN81_05730 [Candidatus Korarchaeota archaeon]